MAPAWDKVKVGLIPRANIRAAVKGHPGAAHHVGFASEIDEMPKAQLLDLASRLGINIKATLKETEYDISGLGSDDTYFPFSGCVEFSITMGILDRVTVRCVRLQYKHSPDWAYLDPRTGDERLGSMAWMLTGLEVEALNESASGTEQSWGECDGLTAPE